MKQLNIEETKEFYKKELIKMQEELSAIFSEDKVSFTLGDQYQLSNTLLYLILEVHVKTRNNEDNYGLCLEVSFQKYDPTNYKIKILDNEIFVLAELTRGDGQIIADFGTNKISLDNDIKVISKKLSVFLTNQLPTIIHLLKNDYLKE